MDKILEYAGETIVILIMLTPIMLFFARLYQNMHLIGG